MQWPSYYFLTCAPRNICHTFDRLHICYAYPIKNGKINPCYFCQDVVNIFFSIHDPTTLNRQGNDIGSQYRSAIFYHDGNQKQISLDTIEKLNEDRLWPNPIVTEITQLGIFYRAEDYHQNYYQLNPNNPYCQFVISPKLVKFKQQIRYK